MHSQRSLAAANIQKWLPITYFLRGAKEGRIDMGRIGRQNCNITPVFSGVPNKGDKITNGYITPAFSGAQKMGGIAT